MNIISLSLGGGIQSTAMALMLQDGYLDYPKPDLAVFAETLSEPPHVYRTLDYVQAHTSFPLLRPSRGNLEEQTFRQAQGTGNESFLDIPVFGHTGIGKRRCTHDYKVATIRRAIRQWAGQNPPALQVTQYLGISLDEMVRVRDSRVAYIVNSYPLAETGLTRQDCLEWLNDNHPAAQTGKSACYYCPFHSTENWREIRDRYPDLFQRAVKLDDILRNRGFSLVRPDKHGVHQGLSASISSSDQQGRFSLDPDQGPAQECEGVCHV